MTGEYDIKVVRGNLTYLLHVRRNITIIRGDSATGKQILADTINKIQTGNSATDDGLRLSLQCKAECIEVGDRHWKETIEDTENSIIFIDEYNHRWLNSEDFARTIKGSQNYFVIITRDQLKQLQYSVTEIYELVESKHYAHIKGIVNVNQPVICRSRILNEIIRPSAVITEDSNQGYELYRELTNRDIKVVSAGSKQKIAYNMLKHVTELPDGYILAIADGAAFGCHYEEVKRLIDMYQRLALYLPEQVEWLILKSGIIPDKSGKIQETLDKPWDYIDSRYVSWETYFDNYLEEATKDIKYLKYDKSKLVDFYKQPDNIEKIRKVMQPRIDLK